MGVPGTGPRRSCYSDTGMLAMPLSKVTENFPETLGFRFAIAGKIVSGARQVFAVEGRVEDAGPAPPGGSPPGNRGGASRVTSRRERRTGKRGPVDRGSFDGEIVAYAKGTRARDKVKASWEKEKGRRREGEIERRGEGGRRKEEPQGAREKEEGEPAFYQDHSPATCQQTLASREEHVGEKTPGKHEERERERG